MGTTDEWLRSGKHLPSVMRDFHFQKDLFKSIYDRACPQEIPLLEQFNWVSAQVFVIDVFLWYMARRGYTLQPVRRVGEYRDLEQDVKEDAARRNTAAAVALKGEQGQAVISQAGK